MQYSFEKEKKKRLPFVMRTHSIKSNDPVLALGRTNILSGEPCLAKFPESHMPNGYVSPTASGSLGCAVSNACTAVVRSNHTNASYWFCGSVVM